MKNKNFYDDVISSIKELREKTEKGYGMGKTKYLIDSIKEFESKDDKLIQAEAFHTYGEITYQYKGKIKYNYKGFIVLLPSAFEIFLQNNKISPSKKIVEFIDDNYQALCKDDLFESIRMIIQNIIFYLTTDFEMKNTSPSFSVKKTIPFTLFMSEILMSENLKDIVLNWLKYLLKSNKLSDAVWFCELVSDLFLSPSFINENDSDYYFFKDLVKKISKKNSLIKSKISQIHLQYNKGLVSKKYYVSLLERLPEADYWPMQNDHLSFNDYLRFPWWKRMGLNNQFRLKSLE